MGNHLIIPPLFPLRASHPYIPIPAGATYSTVPPVSSGRSSRSFRLPLWSRLQKYSTGISLSSPQTLQRNLWDRGAGARSQ